MHIRKLTIYVSLGFLIGLLVLLAVQYFSASSIRQLIRGNEEVLADFSKSNQLEMLQKDVLLMDRKGRLAVTTKEPRYYDEFKAGAEKLKRDVAQLEKFSGNSIPKEDLAALKKLIDLKITQSIALMDSLSEAPDPVYETTLSHSKEFELSEQINTLAARIDTAGRGQLEQKLEYVDRSGKLVLDWNLYVVLVVLVLLIGSFWLNLSRIKSQAALIDQLNKSESDLKRAVEIKERFLANMSHEIRTPLNAILGYSGLLKRKKMDDDAKLHLNTIQQAGETLLSVVNDILDLSKIESGLMRIEKIPFNLEDLIHSVTTLFAQRVQEAGLKFETGWLTTPPGEVVGDPTRLTQILVNLINNSIKFTKEGKVSLKVDFEPVNDESVMAVFVIRDTGIGIEPDKQETIFERFNQAEDSTSRQFGGTGLGLSIVRDLVELQNGSIELKSRPGTGTRMTVRIPYSVVLNRTVLSDDDAEAAVPMQPVSGRVLVVEDNPVNQSLVAHFLTDFGLKCVVVSNGVEAIELLWEQDFDLVLMDIQMPVMNGYEATEKIRNVLQKNVPIVAMTAHAMDGEREKCLSYGMNDHISKPVREAKLREVLMSHLQASKPDPIAAGKAEETPDLYEVIDLDYMREVSGGDVLYEETVALQFLDLFPTQLADLNEAVSVGDLDRVVRLAHGMKSTISIAGIERHIGRDLDILESGVLDESVSYNIWHLNEVGAKAISEISSFYQHLTERRS